MGDKYFKMINAEIEHGKTICEAFLVEIEGTTPRGIGTSMLIKEDGSIEGTIGGGQLEYQVISEALGYIKNQQSGTKAIISYKNEEKNEIISKVKVFFKVYTPKEKLVIFGGGHVAYHLYEIAIRMHFSVVLLDEREDLLTEEKFPHATKLITRNIMNTINQHLITPKTYVVVASSSHQTDEAILSSVLALNCQYIGMLGSKKKVQHIFKNLKDAGMSDDALNQVYAPIGLDIGGDTPEEVALSIIAEIIAIKNHKKVNHIKSF